MRARIVRVDGTSEEIQLPDSPEGGDQLAAMHAAIGCENVRVAAVVKAAAGTPGLDLWEDDDGLYVKPVNLTATFIVGYLYGHRPEALYFGDVLFTGGADSSGEILPLTGMQSSIVADMSEMVLTTLRKYGMISA